jgi:hypothetical protein
MTAFAAPIVVGAFGERPRCDRGRLKWQRSCWKKGRSPNAPTNPPDSAKTQSHGRTVSVSLSV